MSPSLLLTGATGTIGSLLVRELNARGVPVRVLVRTPGRSHHVLTSPLIDVVEGDLEDPASIDAALNGIERVFLLTAPSPKQVIHQGNVVEAIQRTGRPIHVVTVSAVGAVPSNAPLRLAHWHTVTEAQLRSSGLPTTILRPQFLMQNLLRAAPSICVHNMLCGSFGDVRLPLIDARDVAAVAATILTTDGYEGDSYLLTGPQALSASEIVACFSSVLGRPIRYVDMATETYHEHLVGEGLAPWMADDLTELARAFRNGNYWPVTSTVTAITGRPARTLTQFIQDYEASFASADMENDSHAVPCATVFWPTLPQKDRCPAN